MSQAKNVHAFTTDEVVSALIPDIADCERIELVVSEGDLYVKVFESENPIEYKKPEAPEPKEPAGKEVEELKGGDLSKSAAMLCNSAGFQKFLEVDSAEAAKQTIYAICGIESRRELDHNESAKEDFLSLRGDYNEWLSPPF